MAKENLSVRILTALIRGYQLALSPFTRGACRFTPVCSDYATEALKRHGAWRGARLAGARILRCHPFTRGGEDPVPPPPFQEPKQH